MGDTFEKSFQYFSVSVPTVFPVEGAADPIPGDGGPGSYLRLGDTPTPEDMVGQPEPGVMQRHALDGCPGWPDLLSATFAPLNEELRVNAGTAVEYDDSFYKNVGWLDHSNGHRITTTHGDKVEVITGNYKLVVMGRDPNPEGSTGFDMSGGHTVNWAKTPGCVRTITAEGGSFKVTHVTDSGHEYTIFEGWDTDHVVGGSSSVSVMGGANDRTQKGGGPMDLIVDTAWSNKIVDSDFAPEIVDIDAGSPSPAWPTLTETSDLKANAATFATYPTSHGAVVSLPKATKIIEGRSGTDIHEWTSAGTYDVELKADVEAKETITATKMVNSVTVATTVEETWSCAQYTENFTGNRKNVTNAFPGFETEHHFAGNKFDLVGVLSWEDISFGINRTSVQGYAINTDIMTGGAKMDMILAGLHVEAKPVYCSMTGMQFLTKTAEIIGAAVGTIAAQVIRFDFSDLKIEL